ncbi:glutamine-hydrolyzing GMP synthase [[Eubacterium] cellulosolvens]
MFEPSKFVDEAISDLKERITGKAVIAASGGVDSTVATVLAHRAVEELLTAVYVDTGYMRKNESDEIRKMFNELGIKIQIVDASSEFYNALKGIIDPEEKRKIIGEKFIRVFERVAQGIEAEFLVQGTIAPDWIESGGGLRDVIKSHHNVGALPEDMNMTLVEPLRDIYKDEVRKVARFLKIPSAERQPFPGPGLAIRIIGEATPEATEIIREACYITEYEIDHAVTQGRMERPWQYFAVLLPVKTVGVQGDIRAYSYTVAVRAVQSIDAMTAAYSKIPHEILDNISIRITNSMKDKVNRVVFDITNKPPGTIEWE